MTHSAEETILRKISEKAEEMGDELTRWAREKMLLPIGNRVVITIELRKEVAVDVEYLLSGERVHDVEPTEEDWKEVFELPWATRRPQRRGVSTEEMIKTLREMKRLNNYSGHEMHYLDVYRFNAFFKKWGARYKLVGYRIGYTLRVAR